MPNRTTPTSHRYNPYSPSPTRSNTPTSNRDKQDAPVSTGESSGPTPDLLRLQSPIIQPTQDTLQNRGKSIWDLFDEAKLSGDLDRCAELALQMKTIIAEVNTFFSALKQEYNWLAFELRSLSHLEGHRLAFRCSLDKLDDAIVILLQIGDFREALSQKYSWLGATLDKLKNMDKEEANDAVQDLFNSTVTYMKDGGDATGVPVQEADLSNVLLGEATNCEEIAGSEAGFTQFSEDEWEEAEFIEEVRRARLRNLPPLEGWPGQNSQPSDTSTSTASVGKTYSPANYSMWGKNYPIDSVLWALEAEAEGCEYFKTLRLAPCTTVYLHPKFTLNKNRWMYVPIGATFDDPNQWSIGDILFVPIPILFAVPPDLGFEMRTPFQYYVCAPDDQYPIRHKWKAFTRGDSHPLMCKFVLQHLYGQAPFWIYHSHSGCPE
ncbi:hypothetical protein FRC08_006960 [Ceratobasidium sp. 394]|nr:hypothetical protein FRC08_006960 [Ceratobasidium sp. 394]